MALDESFKRWWDEDYSWDGLAKKQWRANGMTLQHYWREIGITENDLIAFDVPETSDADKRRWTRFHLPLRDLKGNPSPKASWSAAELEDFRREIGARSREKEARLDGMVTAGEISFSQQPQVGEIQACFRFAIFSGVANFDSLNFLGNADFESATFSDHASFRSAMFALPVPFRAATFLAFADFGHATFQRDADFESAIFLWRAGFRSVSFSGPAHFKSATFSRHAYFQYATFYGMTNFESAIFGGHANFESATFSMNDRVFFGKTMFLSDADFTATHQQPNVGLVTFDDAMFIGNAIFNNRRFTQTTRFTRARFYRLAKFHNAQVHDDTSFLDTQFGMPMEPLRLLGSMEGDSLRAQLWEKAVAQLKQTQQAEKNPEGNFRSDVLDEFERTFRRLKILTGQHEDRISQRRFFTLEMRCNLAKSTTTPIQRTFGFIYRYASDYGNSLSLPLFLLGVLALAFTVLAVAIAPTPPPTCGHLLPGSDVFSCAVPPAGPRPTPVGDVVLLLQSFLPLFLFTQLHLGASAGQASWLAAMIAAEDWRSVVILLASTIHGVLNIVLWFLFALALRRRFQLD